MRLWANLNKFNGCHPTETRLRQWIFFIRRKKRNGYIQRAFIFAPRPRMIYFRESFFLNSYTYKYVITRLSYMRVWKIERTQFFFVRENYLFNEFVIYKTNSSENLAKINQIKNFKDVEKFKLYWHTTSNDNFKSSLISVAYFKI